MVQLPQVDTSNLLAAYQQLSGIDATLLPVYLGFIAMMVLIQMVQCAATARFFFLSRRIREIGKLPKVMVLLGNVYSVAKILYWSRYTYSKYYCGRSLSVAESQTI